MDQLVAYKVCDSSRLNRHVIIAAPSIESLLAHGSQTINRPFSHVVLENDGCEISSDLALSAFNRELLMLLEAGETWKPDGFYTTQGHGLENEEGHQQTIMEQPAVQGVEHVPQIANVVSSAILQHLKTDQNVFFAISDQQGSSTDPVAMQLLASVEEDQAEASMQSCELQQEDESASKSPEVQQCVDECSMEECDENQSPNTTAKRPQQGSVDIQKSAKKHASCEMKFRCFEINWNKVSDNVIARLNSLQEFKNKNPESPVPKALRLGRSDVSSLVNNVVDQLRFIDPRIKADTMETVSKQVLRKYPCLEFVDDDGFGNGKSFARIKQKMIDRNTYLHRFRESSDQKLPVAKKGRNARAGTLKSYWQNSSKDCVKEVLSKLRRDEPDLLTDEFLTASQAFVRFRFDETKDLKQLFLEFPVLRRRNLMNFHFEKATGVKIIDLRKYYSTKRPKIIEYSRSLSRKFPQLDKDSPDLDVFKFLACIVGENLNDLILKKEIGTRLDDIKMDSSGPLLVSVDMGQERNIYYVYADQTRLSEGTSDFICALEDFMAVHFVHNFKYMKPVSKFSELIQEYFLKIIPTSGSKSNAYRVGNQQRVVKRVITALSNFDLNV